MKTKIRKQLPLPKLLKKCQDVFNAYIRARDRDKGCISCGGPKVEHASHYFNMGHYSALRYTEDNVHGSCVRCNTWLHGNLLEYRKGLIKRIGEEKVKMLEMSSDLHRVKKWHRIELEALIQYYKQKMNDGN